MDVRNFNPLSFIGEASYEGIDLRHSLKNLTHVGDLLLIAFAGTKGHKEANGELGMMMMDYHKLVVDAKLLCGKFVEGCAQSAIKHQYALENVANEKYDVALRCIESCSAIAKDLAVLSNKLACASTSLCDKAQIAFKKTSEAENITIAQRKQLQEDISKLTIQQEALKEQQAQLKQKEILLGEENTRGDNADATIVESPAKEIAELKATLEQRRQSSALLEDKLEKLSEEYYKQAEALEAQAQVASAEVDKTVMERMDLKGDIKRAVEKQYLANNSVETSKAELGLAVRTLSVVQCVLREGYEYWTVVEEKCNLLSNNISFIKDIQPQYKDKLFDCICKSGWNWLVLGKIFHVAHQNLLVIRRNISKTFAQIPSSAEAKELLNAKVEQILAQIKEEEEQLEIIE